MTYSSCPLVYQQDSGRNAFAELLRSFKTSPGRMARISDSIWSCYSGISRPMSAALWTGLQAIYGPLHSTPITTSTSAGVSEAQLHAAIYGDTFDVGVTALGATCQYPCPLITPTPSILMKKVPARGVSTLGYRTILLHDYGTTNAAYSIYQRGVCMDNSADTAVRVYCAAYSGSGTRIRWYWVPPTADATQSLTPLANGYTDQHPELNSASWGIHPIDITFPTAIWTNRATNPYAATFLYGDEASTVAMCAVRWVNPYSNNGLVWDNYSAPGATAQSYLSNYGDCWAAIKAITNPHIVDMCFGTNENGNRSKADFKADLAALIAAIRATSLNPFFILHASTYCSSTAVPEVADTYADAMYELAQADSMIRFHNDRLATERAGWKASAPYLTGTQTATEWYWLKDAAHPSVTGQHFLAKLHIAQMFADLDYPTIAASKAEQLAEDVAAVEAAKANIQNDTTILTVTGTMALAAAGNVLEGVDRGDGTLGTYPSTAASKAEQLAADVAVLEENADRIDDDSTLLTVEGTSPVDRDGIVGTGRQVAIEGSVFS